MMPLKDLSKPICALCAVAYVQEDVTMDEAVCASQDELRRLSAQILTIQENERQRIATDLHDGLGQSLTLVRLGLDECSAFLAENAFSDAEVSLQHLRVKVQNALGELRRVAMDLHPSTLDDLGIIATLSWFFREFENTCRSIKIEKHLLVEEGCIPASVKVAIFRILQEATSNIVKHAKADHIRVNLMKAGNMLHLSIEDNGQGFDPAGRGNNCRPGKGLGLVSMKERAKFSGGTYQIDSAISRGTRIYVSWSCG
ncbi:MAG: sensor histidine kinase [Gallionellaceae bacterium]|jgi:signal transduction histidine kinase